jgi:N-methylhydantoinase A
LARELDIPVVIFPRHPGIASALGCLLVDIRHDLTRMCLFPAEQASTPRIEGLFAELEAEARNRLADDGVVAEAMRLRRTIDMRYAGQWRQLSIEMPRGQGVETALTHFHAEHERAFAFRDEARPVEVYAARVVAEGVVPKPHSIGSKAAVEPIKLPNPVTRRPVYFSERSAYLETPVYKRDVLIAGALVVGPAVVEQLDSTVILSPGTMSSVTPDLHIVTRFEGDAK